MVGDPLPGSGGQTPDAGTNPINNGNNNGSGSGSGSGGSGSGSGTSSGSGSGSGSNTNGCIDAVTSGLGDGHHNPGQDCMNSCHNHGFTVAGTVFDSTSSSNPVAGATVRVVDANNQTVDIVTQLNGNFYTFTTVAFPLTVLATSCPNINHMSATVNQESTGVVGCNQNGCHTSGNWIHVP